MHDRIFLIYYRNSQFSERTKAFETILFFFEILIE